MAFDPNELMKTGETVSFNKRVRADRLEPKTFAGGTGTIKAMTPVARNASNGLWGLWDSDGANTLDAIQGFLWEDLTLVSGAETLAQVMVAGVIHYDEIVLPSEDENDTTLKAGLRATMRAKNIYIDGLDGTY